DRSFRRTRRRSPAHPRCEQGRRRSARRSAAALGRLPRARAGRAAPRPASRRRRRLRALRVHCAGRFRRDSEIARRSPHRRRQDHEEERPALRRRSRQGGQAGLRRLPAFPMTEQAKIARPLPRLILTTPEHVIAFGFGAGLAPFAPGTFGTIVGIPFFLVLMWLPPLYYAVAVTALFVFGCWACDRSAKLLGVHDYGGIVFD